MVTCCPNVTSLSLASLYQPEGAAHCIQVVCQDPYWHLVTMIIVCVYSCVCVAEIQSPVIMKKLVLPKNLNKCVFLSVRLLFKGASSLKLIHC